MILILSGTKEGRLIAGTLKEKGYDVVVSTATLYGKTLIQENNNTNNIPVISGLLDTQRMIEVARGKNINIVIDATHPFAVEVSKNAIAVCRLLKLRYIRYEREETSSESQQNSAIHHVETFQKAAQKALHFPGNIFLTIGSKHLEIFCQEIPVRRIIARVLPQSTILQKCESLGLKPQNIVAMQGPFSVELNKALYIQYSAGVAISKESGQIGGVTEKVQAAKDLGLPVILIARPPLDYPEVVNSVEQLLIKLQETA